MEEKQNITKDYLLGSGLFCKRGHSSPLQFKVFYEDNLPIMFIVNWQGHKLGRVLKMEEDETMLVETELFGISRIFYADLRVSEEFKEI